MKRKENSTNFFCWLKIGDICFVKHGKKGLPWIQIGKTKILFQLSKLRYIRPYTIKYQTGQTFVKN